MAAFQKIVNPREMDTVYFNFMFPSVLGNCLSSFNFIRFCYVGKNQDRRAKFGMGPFKSRTFHSGKHEDVKRVGLFEKQSSNYCQSTNASEINWKEKVLV